MLSRIRCSSPKTAATWMFFSRLKSMSAPRRSRTAIRVGSLRHVAVYRKVLVHCSDATRPRVQHRPLGRQSPQWCSQLVTKPVRHLNVLFLLVSGCVEVHLVACQSCLHRFERIGHHRNAVRSIPGFRMPPTLLNSTCTRIQRQPCAPGVAVTVRSDTFSREGQGHKNGSCGSLPHRGSSSDVSCKRSLSTKMSSRTFERPTYRSCLQPAVSESNLFPAMHICLAPRGLINLEMLAIGVGLRQTFSWIRKTVCSTRHFTGKTSMTRAASTINVRDDTRRWHGIETQQGSSNRLTTRPRYARYNTRSWECPALRPQSLPQSEEEEWLESLLQTAHRVVPTVSP